MLQIPPGYLVAVQLGEVTHWVKLREVGPDIQRRIGTIIPRGTPHGCGAAPVQGKGSFWEAVAPYGVCT